MSAPFYFDGCYLGLPYFDSPPCVAPVVSGGRLRHARFVPLDPEDPDDLPLILLLSG